MNDFWKGFILFPGLVAVLVGLVALSARFSRGIIQWYIGIPLTRWWSMGLLCLALKHIPQKRVKVLRAQGRVWISPLVKAFEDKDALQ